MTTTTKDIRSCRQHVRTANPALDSILPRYNDPLTYAEGNGLPIPWDLNFGPVDMIVYLDLNAIDLLLSGNLGNRTLNRNHVEKLKDLIRRGKSWRPEAAPAVCAAATEQHTEEDAFCHDLYLSGIAFRLINGAHRLTAAKELIESGEIEELRVKVNLGLEPADFIAFDVDTKTRSKAQQSKALGDDVNSKDYAILNTAARGADYCKVPNVCFQTERDNVLSYQTDLARVRSFKFTEGFTSSANIQGGVFNAIRAHSRLRSVLGSEYYRNIHNTDKLREAVGDFLNGVDYYARLHLAKIKGDTPQKVKGSQQYGGRQGKKRYASAAQFVEFISSSVEHGWGTSAKGQVLYNYQYRLFEVCLVAFLLGKKANQINVGGPNGKRIKAAQNHEAFDYEKKPRRARPIFPTVQIQTALELVG
jgi:hypothetical protein